MAEFVPMEITRAKDFLQKNHYGVLATRRKNGDLQMSPVTCGLDSGARAVISSRETAYKVNNLRRDPRAALCVFTPNFHGGGWAQINGFRGETPTVNAMRKRILCDLWYVQNFGLLLDLKILLCTPFELLRQRNAR
jgi:PPOX class probable F420-dependent enzyme